MSAEYKASLIEFRFETNINMLSELPATAFWRKTEKELNNLYELNMC